MLKAEVPNAGAAGLAAATVLLLVGVVAQGEAFGPNPDPAPNAEAAPPKVEAAPKDDWVG